MSAFPKSRAFVVSFLAAALLAALTLGARQAMRSSLFIVQSVEVSDPPTGGQVSAAEISALAGVEIGRSNLFSLDLPAVEARILVNPWIREVRLTKRFPQTLSIGVTIREPRALVQLPGGALAYVDDDLKVFGRVNLLTQADLPVLFGFSAARPAQDAGEAAGRLAAALRLVDGWESSPLQGVSQLSSVSWDPERGYRAMTIYLLDKMSRARATVDFGREVDPSPEVQFRRLAGVIRYLKVHSIEASQIWADSGKKIVVRTARGS